MQIIKASSSPMVSQTLGGGTSNSCFHELSRWFQCTMNFEKHCIRLWCLISFFIPKIYGSMSLKWESIYILIAETFISWNRLQIILWRRHLKWRQWVGRFSMSSTIAELVQMYILREFWSLVQKLQT